jgi:predicted metal-dependent hydrolase
MKEEMPIEFWEGIEQFNSQDFYACHDTLEALWMEAGEPEKKFYQGILQIAVGFYHLGNQNWRGAVILLGEGINRLNYYQPIYAGIAVEKLLGQSAKLLSALQEAGSEKVAEFVPLLTGAEVAGLRLPRIIKVKQTSIDIS